MWGAHTNTYRSGQTLAHQKHRRGSDIIYWSQPEGLKGNLLTSYGSKMWHEASLMWDTVHTELGQKNIQFPRSLSRWCRYPLTCIFRTTREVLLQGWNLRDQIPLITLKGRQNKYYALIPVRCPGDGVFSGSRIRHQGWFNTGCSTRIYGPRTNIVQSPRPLSRRHWY